MNIECEGTAMTLGDRNLLLGPNDNVLQKKATVILVENSQSLNEGWDILCPFMQRGNCTAIISDLKTPLPGTKYSDGFIACKYTRTNPAKLPPHETKAD